MVIWLIFAVILLIISVNDFLFFRIENEYILSVLALYIFSCLCGISGHNFLSGLEIATATFIIAFIMNRYDLIGGGDVKLSFPMLLFAENNLQPFIIGTSVGGLVLAAFYFLFSRQIFFFRRKIVCSLYISYKKQNKSFLLNIVLLSFSRINKRTVALSRCITDAMKQEIPYGVALSCGGFYVIIENLVAR